MEEDPDSSVIMTVQDKNSLHHKYAPTDTSEESLMQRNNDKYSFEAVERFFQECYGKTPRWVSETSEQKTTKTLKRISIRRLIKQLTQESKRIGLNRNFTGEPCSLMYNVCSLNQNIDTNCTDPEKKQGCDSYKIFIRNLPFLRNMSKYLIFKKIQDSELITAVA